MTPDEQPDEAPSPSNDQPRTVVELQDHDPTHFEPAVEGQGFRVRGHKLKGKPTPELVKALCEARKAIEAEGPIPKSGYNSDIDHEYSTYDDVNGVVGPALADAGLWVFPTVVDTCRQRTGKTRSGNPRYTVTMVMEFTLTDGESHVTLTMTGENQQHGDSHHYALQSQISRYALSKLLWLESGDPEVDQENQSNRGQQRPRSSPETKDSNGKGNGGGKPSGTDVPVAIPAHTLDERQRKNARDKHGLELHEEAEAYTGTLSPGDAMRLEDAGEEFGFTVHAGPDAEAFIEDALEGGE